MTRKCTEQYSRCSCIRIHGVKNYENDDVNVMNKIEKCYDEIFGKFDPKEKDRLFQIGKPVFDADSKQKTRLIIVKFETIYGIGNGLL